MTVQFRMPTGEKKMPALNPAPVQVAPPPPPPPPPPPVVAFAPPPPPVAAHTASDYHPVFSDFFFSLVTRFAAALQPAGYNQADSDQAEKTAEKVAIALDGGPWPKGYVLPRIARLLGTISRAEHLNAAVSGAPLPYAQVVRSVHAGTPQAGQVNQDGSPMGAAPRYDTAIIAPPVMPEGERQKEREKLAAAERELGGPIPTKADAMSDNERALAAFGTLSLKVRDAAASAAIAHISGQSSITGAPAREADVFNVLAFELERAIRLAGKYGMPVRAPEYMNDEENASFGPAALPWPAGLALAASAPVLNDAFEQIADLAARGPTREPSRDDTTEHDAG